MSFGVTHRSSPTVPLAAMLDVLFLLLVFFVTTYSLREEETEFNLNLPKAGAAMKQQQQRSQVVVNIDAQGIIKVSGRRMNLAGLRQTLAQLVQTSPDEHVVIRGDKQTDYQYIIDVMDTAKAVGIRHIHCSTIKTASEIGG